MCLFGESWHLYYSCWTCATKFTSGCLNFSCHCFAVSYINYSAYVVLDLHAISEIFWVAMSDLVFKVLYPCRHWGYVDIQLILCVYLVFYGFADSAIWFVETYIDLSKISIQTTTSAVSFFSSVISSFNYTCLYFLAFLYWLNLPTLF